MKQSIDSIIDGQLSAAEAAGDIGPSKRRRSLENYVRITKRLKLDPWQIDLCRRLETAFWLSTSDKFEFEYFDIGTGPAFYESPSGLHIPKEEFETKRNTGARDAYHAPPQMGKPCYDGSMVLMGSGAYKRLDEIVKGDEVITHRGRARPVSAVHVQGELECVEVVTNTGRRTVAALDHPFLTPEGWVEAGKLVVGQCVANASEVAITETSDRRDAEFEMLGYFVGDGCVAKSPTSIHANITSADLGQASRFIEVGSQLGFQYRSLKKQGTHALTYAFRGGVRPWLRGTGIAGSTSGLKRVPEWIFRGSTSQVALFLGAYFSCDGTLSLKGLDRHGHPRPDGAIEFYSVSEGLLRDVQSLLLRVGVQSRVCLKNGRYNGSLHESWRLTITSQDYIAQFARTVPVPGIKGEKLRQLRAYRQTFQPQILPDRIVEIRHVGKKPCRCLTVEEDHTFTVDDIIVHNSCIISQCYAAWIFGWDPMHRFRLATYSERRSAHFSVVIKGLIRSIEHQELFPDPAGHIPIRSKSLEWYTNARLKDNDGQPSFSALGLQSGFVGIGADTLVMDDPYRSAEDALSEIIRDKTWRFWTDTASVRMGERSNVFIMFHRYHQDDMGGRAIGGGEFNLIRYAAQCDGTYHDEASGRDFPDPMNRAEGEYLSPRFGELYYLRNKKNSSVWLSQFQGQPTAKTGKTFNVELIQTIPRSKVPDILFWVRAWDNAATSGGGAFTAGLLMGIDAAENIYVFDVKREQVNTAERELLQLATAEEDGKLVEIHIPEDPGSAGKDVAFDFTQVFSREGYKVTAKKAGTSEDDQGRQTYSRNKIMRAHNWSKAVNFGRTFFVLGVACTQCNTEWLISERKCKQCGADESRDVLPAWHRALRIELQFFPAGTYKDQVDAGSDGYTHLTKLFFRGLVIKSASEVNLLHRSLFMQKFGAKVHPHWEVAAAIRIAENSSLPSGFAIVARAAENAYIGDVVFILSAARMFADSPMQVLRAFESELVKHCAKGVEHPSVIWLIGMNAVLQVAAQKMNLYVTPFLDEPTAGIPETNHYFQRIERQSPFYQRTGTSRCLILTDDNQFDERDIENEDGMLSLRQDLSSWTYTDKGEVQPFAGITLDCVRATLYKFALSATGLSDDEKLWAQMPRELMPSAIEAKRGTPEYVEALLAQEHALTMLKIKNYEQGISDRRNAARNGQYLGKRAVSRRYRRA